MHGIVFAPAAERYLKKIRESGLRKAYHDAFARIAADPRSGERKHGDLQGLYGFDVYYKGTNYEIAYRIDEADGKCVVVVLAGTRENFYKELKRHLG